MALLTYNATVTLTDQTTLTIDQLLGDGTDPTKDNQLPHGAVIASIDLPEPRVDEHASYFRSISRFEAEWPLVECVVRARFEEDRIADCALAIGGVAAVPLRMSEAEDILSGASLSAEVIKHAATACTNGATPLPETHYKVKLIAGTVQQALEQLSTQAANASSSER